jgi:arylsulfatase A-like enzyme
MTLYDEQVHVPLLVRWPRGWQGPVETEQLVRGIALRALGYAE